jgi:hypothetical protein
MKEERQLSQIPRQLIGGLADLPDLLSALATLRGIPRSEADGVVAQLPAELRSAPCFLDRLTATWRYIFGEPLVGFPNGQVVVGTHMYHEVSRLFDVVACAQKRLPPNSLFTYLTALDKREKHEDALVEFAPILRLDSESEAVYEVAGAGNARIDWRISTPEQKTLLLEVKNRIRDLFEGLCQLQAHAGTTDASPEPAHDANLLFRSIENKFSPHGTNEVIQAVWIKTDLKQEETELQTAFGRLGTERVQVAVLGDWGDDAYVLANDDAAKELVLRTLRISESRRFVFQRGVPV